MQRFYPLRFQPLPRRYLWGGRRLETVLGKQLPPGDDYAESWEVVDHGSDQSIVVDGWLSGKTLHELVESYGRPLLGRHHPQPRFPLLFKFLDAHRKLSVQVHPNDVQAAALDPPDLGKTEAWLIVAAEPGSCLYAGLKRGFDRAALERELTRGTVELCLYRIEPRVGDCIFIPAGTVHALGEGLVVAEIQQASDTTFRIHDWNRLGPDGKPRPLHIEAALEVIDFDIGPVDPHPPEPTGEPHVERLVECDKFILDRHRITHRHAIAGDSSFHVLAVIEGGVEVADDAAEQPLNRGQTMLVPAVCDELTVTASGDAPAVVLDMYVP